MSQGIAAATDTAANRTPRKRLRVSGSGGMWLGVPAAVFLVFFFVWPLVTMLMESFTDPSPGLTNYKRLFQTESIMHSLWFTAYLSSIVTVLCATLGYIYTYTAVKASPRVRGILLLLVLLPAAVNILVRVFSIQVLMQDQGIINKVLKSIGLIDQPLSLIRTPFAIGFGMVTTLLPFMVFPLFNTMRQIDPELPLAAKSLGATPAAAFWKVTFPLSRPGLFAGCLLVFVSSLGYFVVPQLLGNNASDRFLSQYTSQYVSQGEWGLGAAIGVVLLVLTLVTLMIVGRLVNVGETLRASVGGR